MGRAKRPGLRVVVVPLLVGAIAGCDDPKVKPEKDDSADTKKERKKRAEKKPEPKVITPEDIGDDMVLGGAAVPHPPPPPVGSSSSAPAPGAAAPAPMKAEANAAAEAAPAPAPAPKRLLITHDHAPGEECEPLRKEELEKAFADLGP